MKHLLRIFELAKNEQHVVLIIMLVLIMFAFVGYERRVQQHLVRPASATEANPSATPAQTEDER
jgi:hypothetical protein